MYGRKIVAIIIGVLALALASVLVYANMVVLRYSNFYASAFTAPTSSIAIIFGGGMNELGDQTPFQEDRVRMGVALYKAGKVQQLVVTGDDGGNHDNEVAAMKTYALSFGLPSSAVLIDPHGYRTYESCYRERVVYGITRALVISQSFHVPRILYLCNSLGVRAEGVSADLRDYDSAWYRAEVREVLARVKAWWQLEISRPLPRNLQK